MEKGLDEKLVFFSTFKCECGKLLMRRISDINNLIDRVEPGASALDKIKDYDGYVLGHHVGCDECERIYFMESGEGEMECEE